MEYQTVNRKAWNTLTKSHLQSDFYDLEGFKAGTNSLCDIALGALPNVNSKDLLHLQCHFGMETLSWARNGARVTGVDLSPDAIDAANELRDELGLNGEFICSDIYDFGRSNERQYDIVFTSYGVLNWLPDLTLWAETIAKSLKPGGTFFIVEYHPSYWLMDGYPYFPQKNAIVEEWEDYTEQSHKVTSHEWPHSLGEIISALLNAGLRLDSFEEYPFHYSNWLDRNVEREKGKWYREHQGNDEPLLFSITATKE